MENLLNFYAITLDFIFKCIGPITGIAAIGLCYKHRKEIANFILANVTNIKARILNQEFDIELKKQEQSKPVLPKSERSILENDREQLIKELEFEKIYSIIFNSQIIFLKNCQSNYSTVDAATFLDYTKEVIPVFKSWNLQDFTQVLVKNGLVDKDEVYTITDKGLAFLAYIEKNNYNDRPF
jgi:hypothetical protein